MDILRRLFGKTERERRLERPLSDALAYLREDLMNARDIAEATSLMDMVSMIET